MAERGAGTTAVLGRGVCQTLTNASYMACRVSKISPSPKQQVARYKRRTKNRFATVPSRPRIGRVKHMCHRVRATCMS
jgi:hypothetical protein